MFLLASKYVEKNKYKHGDTLHGRTNMDFSTSKIIVKRIWGNNMDFSTSEITSKKVRGNDVDFLISEIPSKKYVEMTWKFVKIWSLTYWRNIDVESMWIRRGVPVGMSDFQRFPTLIQRRCPTMKQRSNNSDTTLSRRCFNVASTSYRDWSGKW